MLCVNQASCWCRLLGVFAYFDNYVWKLVKKMFIICYTLHVFENTLFSSRMN